MDRPGAELIFNCRQDFDITPDIYFIALVSDKPGTLELRELSLAINTPGGMVIVLGCSHPGVAKIVEVAQSINLRIILIARGFHLVAASDGHRKIVTALHDRFKVEYIGLGHCTGEPAFTRLGKAFRDRYRYAGLGTTLAPPSSHRGKGFRSYPRPGQMRVRGSLYCFVQTYL